MTKRYLFLTLPIILLFQVLFCSEPENWYLNAELSKAELAPGSLHNGDTIPIFSTKTIGTRIYLREHLSHISISVPGNRLWRDTILTSAEFNKKPLEFHISFFDTGWQEITLISHRLNGDSITGRYRVFAVSPLKQKPLEIFPGETVNLETPPVKDDVSYVWDLHSITIEHRLPKKQLLFEKMPASDIGEIYVIDGKGNQSPSSFFTITPKRVASTTPQFTIDNQALLNDTIYASTPAVPIAGHITKAASIARVTINNVLIDSFTIIDSNFHFLYEFSRLDSLLAITAVVQIIDTTSLVVSDTFYIAYKPSISVTTPSIVLLYPALDSSSADNETVAVHGMVVNSDKYPAGAITMTKNQNKIPGFTYLSKNGYFGIPVFLDVGRNSIVFEFLEDTLSRNVLIEKNITVYYDPATLDTLGPEIRVLYEGTAFLDSMMLRRADPAINILIHDNSPIKNVTVNGIPALLSANRIDALPTYTATLSLSHTPTNVTIITIDENDNLSTLTLKAIRFNQLPVISGNFIDRDGFAGEFFTWKSAATDPDGDPLTVTASVNGDIVIAAADGTLQWKSDISDAGWHTVTIQAYDSYESARLSFDIYVSEQSVSGVAVQWYSDSTDIPATLTAGEDTLEIVLKANPISNLKPFRYKVEDGTKVLYDGTDSLFVWVPDSTMIGFHSLKFTITDNANNSDYFTDAVTVLSPTPAVIQFLNASSGNNESAGTVAIPVVLSKALSYPVSIGFDIDTALTTAEFSDFSLPEQKTITFLPGDTTASIPLVIYNNSIAESDRKIVLKLMNVPIYLTTGSQNKTTFKVLDDDFVNYTFFTSLGISSSGWYSRGVDSVFIEVSLSKPLPKQVTLACKIDPQYTTATTSDYTLPATSQKLTIAAGTTKDTVILLILPNNRIIGGFGYQPSYEKKVVALKLSAADTTDRALREGNITLYKYTIGEETAFYIDSTKLSVYEDDSIKIIGVRRKDTIYSDVSFYFEINRELTTAIEDVDFTLTTASPMTFEYTYLRSKQIKVRVFDDKIKESSKKVVIDITSVTSPGYLDPSCSPRIEITIRDDD